MFKTIKLQLRQGVEHFLDSPIPATPHPFIQLYQGFVVNKRAIRQ
ncbi:hypothetical protein [Nostoc sp. FACHB-892]|nr:hypothetical protein [Nostoc sp. FACHB-892]